MKKLLFLLLFTPLFCLCQNNDIGYISISAVIPDYDNIPAEALHNLETKLQSLVTTQGISDHHDVDRFVITARVDIVSKDVTATTPPRISMKMELTLIIGDVLENKVYGTETINLAGVGLNETKTYIAAFQQIKPNNPKLQQYIQTTKEKIVDYYSHNCQNLIIEAERKATMGQYDDAITMLITVPPVNNDCYTLCQNKSIEIYNQKVAVEREAINKEGKELIRQARSTWSVKHDYECAEKALDILSKVSPDAECVGEADNLVNEINKTLRKKESQEAAAAAARAKAQWEFKMRKYEDDLAYKQQAQSNRAQILGTLAERFGKIDINFKKERTFGWSRNK